MKTRKIGLLLAVLLSVISSVNGAFAQQQSLTSRLAGTWSWVSVVNTLPDGKSFDPNNGQPTNGLLMFDQAGNFSWQIIRADIPKIAANNRLRGTPEENKAVAQGTLAYFGTYTDGGDGKSILMTIKASSYANFVGPAQRREIVLSGDQLTVINQAGASGGKAAVTWKRMQ